MSESGQALLLEREAEDAGLESTGEDSRGDRRWPPRRTVVELLAAVLVVAAVAAAVVLAVQLRSQRAIEDAGRQALAVAQQYAVVLTSVDAAHLDDNFAAVIDGATGQFKDMYSQSSAHLKRALLDNRAKAEGNVMAAGIRSATKDKVEVMLFVNQAVTNAANPQPRLDYSRILITMEKVNGRWLASNVDLP